MTALPQNVSFTTWRAGGYANTAAPRRADPASLQQLAGQTMGTYWSLKFDNPSMLPLQQVTDVLTASFDTVIQQMSTWEPGSDISRFSQAPAATCVALKPEFAKVLECALYWFDQSGGALDPTVGPLVSLWGFGAHSGLSANQTPVTPSPERIAAAIQRVGCSRLAYDAASHSIVQPGGMELDFSGIAKGFAVDLAAEALASLGIKNFLMEIGGELVARGHRPNGAPWRVQIDPGVEGVKVSPLALQDMAMATSGDQWHSHAMNDTRWAHTIDPRTAMPASTSMASVTVLHAECMHADALATVLTVLGPESAPDFAEQHAIAALFVMRDGNGAIRVHRSSHFQNLER